MIRLEALADAIASLNDWSNPGSDAYRLRNPGLLRAYKERHIADEQGLRVFPSIVDGYRALLFDLKYKCSGENSWGIKKNSVIRDLLVKGFRQAPASEEYVLCFLQSVFQQPTVSSNTPISFFLED